MCFPLSTWDRKGGPVLRASRSDLRSPYFSCNRLHQRRNDVNPAAAKNTSKKTCKKTSKETSLHEGHLRRESGRTRQERRQRDDQRFGRWSLHSRIDPGGAGAA